MLPQWSTQQELSRHILKSRTDSGSLQNGLEAAAFCYTSAHGTPLLFNMPLVGAVHPWWWALAPLADAAQQGFCWARKAEKKQKSREKPKKQRKNKTYKSKALLEFIRTKIKRRILGMWAVFISASTHWLCQSRQPTSPTGWGMEVTFPRAPRALPVIKPKLKQRGHRGCTHTFPMPTLALLILHLFFQEPEEMGNGYFKIYNYGHSNHQN